MASVKKSEIPEIAAFMTEFWSFVKKYWIVEECDEYWAQLVEEADEMFKRYPDEFCKRQVVSYVDYLSAKLKKDGFRG